MYKIKVSCILAILLILVGCKNRAEVSINVKGISSVSGSYTGTMKNKLPNGEGTFKSSETGDYEYTGTFINGVPNGKGTLQYDGVMTETGIFRDGVVVGGILQYKLEALKYIDISTKALSKISGIVETDDDNRQIFLNEIRDLKAKFKEESKLVPMFYEQSKNVERIIQKTIDILISQDINPEVVKPKIEDLIVEVRKILTGIDRLNNMFNIEEVFIEEDVTLVNKMSNVIIKDILNNLIKEISSTPDDSTKIDYIINSRSLFKEVSSYGSNLNMQMKFVEISNSLTRIIESEIKGDALVQQLKELSEGIGN